MSRPLTRIVPSSVFVAVALAWVLAPAWPARQAASRGTAAANGRTTPPISAAPATRRSIRSTPSNFSKLEVAWRFKTDNLGPRPEYKLEGTPLMVNGVLYTTGGTRRSVVALDAKTGELIWSHSLREGKRAAVSPRQLSGRGVSYWTDGKGDERILYVTTGYRLVALNAKTGAPIPSFGKKRHRRSEGGRRERHRPADRSRDRRDRRPLDADRRQGRGHRRVVACAKARPSRRTTTPRGWCARSTSRTGKLLWQFNTIPRPGEFGNDTWENESWADQRQHRRLDADHASTKSSASSTCRSRRRRPTSTAAIGPGNNLFAESLVCVDLKTGQRKWHFQFVHHPIWNFDMSSAPLLADITVDGKPIKAVAVPSKQAWLYVFDRVTGQPVWPIEERPVPQSDVPGEKACADAAVSDQAAALRAQLPQGARRSDRLHAGAARARRSKQLEALQVGPSPFTPPILGNVERAARR